MSVHIDRSNYEEFYLDYLEGNLSGDAVAAFEAFLQANPDLAIDDEGGMVLQPTDERLDPVTRLSLKQSHDLDALNAENLDYFLIARQEGLLSASEEAQLDHWLQANARYRNDEKLMRLTTLRPSGNEVYTAKSKLKQPAGRVIPLPVWLGSVAAAAGLAFFLTMTDGSPVTQPQSNTPVASNDIPSDAANTTAPATVTGPSAVQDAIPAAENHKAVKPVKVTEVLPPVEVGQLPKRDVALAHDPALVPLNIEKPAAHKALPTALNDLAHIKTDEMRNPIKPITNRLSTALNTEVDFRTAKAAKKRGGGFYLKIGKLEISHRSASL